MNRKTIEGSKPTAGAENKLRKSDHTAAAGLPFQEPQITRSKTSLFRLRKLNHGQEPA
jgi:hypothetical protein